MRNQRSTAVGRGVAILVVLSCMAGCTQMRTVVITNSSSEAYELRRDGAKTAIVVDSGGSTSLRVRAGEPIDVDGAVIQVY